MADTKTFIGIGWSFLPTLNNEGKGTPTVMVANEENIRQSLFTLLGTSPGERVHRYDYGCPLREYAFDVMNNSTRTMLKNRIEEAIIQFEPRVIVNCIDFNEDSEAGVLSIEIDYTIRQTNHRTNMVYPFYFVEGTDLVKF